MIRRIRQRLWPDKHLGELARDIDDALGKLTDIPIKQFDGQYTEPMYVSHDHEPMGLLCIRIREVGAMETPVLSGGLCHWTWEGSRKRCRIDSIDGMTPTPGTTFRFTFAMVG